MDSKKSSNANLERYRFTFLLVGLTIYLGLVILIFQWRFFEPNLTKHLKAQRETIEKELPPVYVLREVPVKKERFTEKKKIKTKDPIKTKPKKLVAVSNKVDVPSIIEPLDSLNW